MSIVLKRNYEIYISKSNSAPYTQSNTVKILVKDFDFNQSANIDKASRETLDPLQERTVDPFVSLVSPVTFSLTTYILPLVDTNVTSPEEYLWLSLLGNEAGISNNPTTSTINFAQGNVGSLHELTLWFRDSNNTDSSYRIDNAIIDSATINFDINNIAEIEWKGRALSMTRDTPPTAGNFTPRDNEIDYLKTRLSTISLELGGATTYTVALTGGSINFENNNTFHNRTQLGKTTVPVGHYTGNREITGDLDFYLKQGVNLSADLYEALRSTVSSDTYETSQYANITIIIGGTATTVPRIELNVPLAILNLPTINFEEALTMQVPFTAKEGTGTYSTINYKAQ